MEDLRTGYPITWCPGCTNFGIYTVFMNVVKELEAEGKIDRKKLVFASGIGCAGKMHNYINLSSFSTLHGRALAVAVGIKLANPELTVVTFQGDGDTYNEGVEHLVSACKENPDVKLFVHNNQVFALTTAQHTFTTEPGYYSKSLGLKVFEKPLNPIALALISGATFVARGYALWLDHLKYIMKEAILHKGFAFVDIIQPCIAQHDTRKYYESHMYKLEDVGHDYNNFNEALNRAFEYDYTLREDVKIPVGIFYKTQRITLQEGLNARPFYKVDKKLNIEVLKEITV
ncbi:2-oxoacid:ferredoxin oxidoreductase subunit beta [Nanoarchaeota archaeon]